MEHIILSLLLLSGMTIYEIRSYIKNNLSTICSDSTGSIQATLKKLLSEKYVCINEIIDNGVLKKKYEITESGLLYYKERLGNPMNIQKIKNMELGKLFFLGIAGREKRIRFLNDYLESLYIERESLQNIQAMVENHKEDIVKHSLLQMEESGKVIDRLLEISEENIPEDIVGNIFDYQMYMLEYGLERIKGDIVFFEKMIEREKNHK